MQKEESGNVSSWLLQQASTSTQGHTLTKSARSKSGSSRSKIKSSLKTPDTAVSLDRTSSHVSTSSLDSALSAASGWSPRTVADAHSKQQRPNRKPDRIRSGMLPTRTDTQDFTAESNLVESSLLSNASLDSDSTADSKPLAIHTSRLSPAKTSRQGSGTLLHTQHSILDPLPEKPTDVVRHRKVFGSTYSVGKLGELPYTPPRRTRGSLSQPPWVAAAKPKATVSSNTYVIEKLRSLVPVSSFHSHDLEDSTSQAGLPHPPVGDASAQSILIPAKGEGDKIMADDTQTQTSQLFHSFSLLEPSEPTHAHMPTASSLNVPPEQAQTSSLSGSFQRQSHPTPAESATPAMLMDLQSHDRQSQWRESQDQLQLAQSEDEGLAGECDEGTSGGLAALQQQAGGDCLALDTPTAHAATACPQRMEEMGLKPPQPSGGVQSQRWKGLLQPSSDGPCQEVAADGELPFALSRDSSRGQWHMHPSSSSCSSYTSIERVASIGSRLISMMQPDEEDVPSEKVSSTSSSHGTSATEEGEANQLTHRGEGHPSSLHATVESSNLASTTAADAPLLPTLAPQLWTKDRAGARPDRAIDGSPPLPVSVVAEALQQRATATAQPQPSPLRLTSDLPPLSCDLPQLTVAMPGSPTGPLLPDTGTDLLDRPGSSPLPVSKMLRMVSEDQASLLSDLAAQCAAPGGLLGSGPTEQVQQDLTGMLGSAPACCPSSQTAPHSADCSSQQAQQTQHAQRSLQRHTSPRLECTADAAHQVSAASSAPGCAADESYLQSPLMQRSPLRQRLSQFFSPIFGSASPQSPHSQQSSLQKPLLRPASQAQSQQLQQQLPEGSSVTGHVQHGSPAQLRKVQPEDDAAVHEAVVWQLPTPPLSAAALLVAGRSAVFPHDDAGHLLQSPAAQGVARSLSEMVQQLFTDDQLSKDCARALSLQLSSLDTTDMQQIQADAHLLQQCLARFILWKDQLLQHCTDHESAMRQYCLEVDSAMAQQEQKLLGQAANTLQQRDAALSALHQVEEEVQHFKVTVAELRGQLDGEAEDAHFDIDSWSQFFTPETSMGRRLF